MDSIRWLQISDLHIFLNDPSWEDFQKYLQDFFSSNPNPDFVVITGDYRNVWANEGYDKAERFIRVFMQQFGLDISRDLFMVPGNHDMRPQKKKTITTGNFFWRKQEEIDDDPRTHELKKLLPLGLAPWDRTEKSCEWMDKHLKEPKNYLDRLCEVQRNNAEDENLVDIEPLVYGFSDYCGFAKQLIPWYGESSTSPAVAHIRKWEKSNNLGFNLVHLNTALVADGSRNHYQALDLNSTKKVLNGIRSGLPTLILAHNSFYDLHPDIQKQLIGPLSSANTCVWLCGDVHRFDAKKTIDRPPSDERNAIPILICGKGAPDYRDDYSDNGFFLYEYDGNLINVQKIIWDQLETQKIDEMKILIDSSSCSYEDPMQKRLMIGYLSCNPAIDLKKKYHLGHAYFIHKIDQIIAKRDYAFIMTSSFLLTHNRTRDTYRSDQRYSNRMIDMWKECFNGRVEVFDIKDHFQQSVQFDDAANEMLYYVTKMEMLMEMNDRCHDIIDGWFKTRNIDISDYNYIKDCFEVSHGSAIDQTELLSFVYLLHKRPMWYNCAWLVRFIDFWNRSIYYLIREKLKIEVSANDIFILESSRNHYVWDAISYCAKRFSYGNFPRVEYFESLYDIDCLQPMKSSNSQKAIFLSEYNVKKEYGDNFGEHVKKMFSTEKDPYEIAEEYFNRLFKE